MLQTTGEDESDERREVTVIEHRVGDCVCDLVNVASILPPPQSRACNCLVATIEAAGTSVVTGCQS